MDNLYEDEPLIAFIAEFEDLFYDIWEVLDGMLVASLDLSLSTSDLRFLSALVRQQGLEDLTDEDLVDTVLADLSSRVLVFLKLCGIIFYESPILSRLPSGYVKFLFNDIDKPYTLKYHFLRFLEFYLGKGGLGLSKTQVGYICGVWGPVSGYVTVDKIFSLLPDGAYLDCEKDMEEMVNESDREFLRSSFQPTNKEES